MRPSEVLLGAMRLRWTTKMGNKHYFKGTRQAFVPGEGRRTGLPGKHSVKGRGKFQIDDHLVRYYVSPGAEALANTEFKPYVHRTETTPTLQHLGTLAEYIQREQAAKRVKRLSFEAWEPKHRQALITERRRGWWNALAKKYPAAPAATDKAAESGESQVEQGQ
ncbi:hypothetical protein BCR39DRAFT_548842 [Naematelia encephala]|uniref:Mitochondrial ribosomal protein L27-domain-containing protein n=1 Tax=Naematelia encephala TaxID=71784 RepID=A0A1Y2AMI2_9TREE|nr:hypothetical protein BCR39DRAFT_548842 [Naematelia encephala]